MKLGKWERDECGERKEGTSRPQTAWHLQKVGASERATT